MDLLTIALTICLQTDNLDCDNIPVEVTQLKHGVAGHALLYRSGNMKIEVNEHFYLDASKRDLKSLLVHEYAHLQTYKEGHLNGNHGNTFRNNCLELASRVGVSTYKTCSESRGH